MIVYQGIRKVYADITKVVFGDPHFRNALRFHTFLGRRLAHENLREYLERESQVPAVYPPRCPRFAHEAHHVGSVETTRQLALWF